MSLLDSLILGVVQGITEFLPVSSSGHLVIVRDFLGLNTEYGLAFDAVLHLATALAVLVYFRREVWQIVTGKNSKLLLALVLGTIPAVVVGFVFQDYISATTRSTEVVVWMLILGSLLFITAELLAKNSSRISGRRGFWIGMYQMLALVPGISRSGASISGGMLFGLDRESAAKFAFLLSFPILVGVGLLKLFELGSVGVLSGTLLHLLVGSAVAFVVGLLSIRFMIGFVRRYSLYIFVVYRILLAVVVWFYVA